MPRPAFSNLKRRGAAYWWRRKILLVGLSISEKLSICCEFSLRTKELDLARGRSAAMTAYSEVLKMSLRTLVAKHGLDQQTAAAIFNEELRSYRDELVHLEAAWRASPVFNPISSNEDLAVFQCLWEGLATDGIGVPRDWSFIERHFAQFDQPMKVRIKGLLRDHPDLPDTIRQAAIQRLETLGLEPNAFNVPVAADLIVSARAAAAKSVRELPRPYDPTALLRTVANRQASISSASQPSLASMPPAASPEPILHDAPLQRATPPRPPKPKASPLTEEQQYFAAMSPSELAEEFIKEKFSQLDHRTGNKRQKSIVGESTYRDLRWAALLLEKTMPPGTPFSQVTADHYRLLDGWFDRLPVTIGKSPWDKEPSTTFEMIEAKAIDRLEAGELEADQIGLTVGTTNKHWHNIRRMHEHLRTKLPNLQSIDVSCYITAEDRDSREARDKLSIAQATSIFRLPPWTGCAGITDRLAAGTQIIHDGLFFVLLLVWYTGARREEICKLQIDDVFQDESVPYLFFRNTSTGRLKNKNSKRKLPIHSELIRLGFLSYVEAMRSAGETLLFPELYPAASTKRAIGDVFYKLWWIYIRPHVPDLKRGQAMHSARHAVSDALKQAGIDLESRNDILGHSQMQLGEGASTYSEPVELERMKGMVEQIPSVTQHLPNVTEIVLLPESLRVARPSRNRKD